MWMHSGEITRWSAGQAVQFARENTVVLRCGSSESGSAAWFVAGFARCFRAVGVTIATMMAVCLSAIPVVSFAATSACISGSPMELTRAATVADSGESAWNSVAQSLIEVASTNRRFRSQLSECTAEAPSRNRASASHSAGPQMASDIGFAPNYVGLDLEESIAAAIAGAGRDNGCVEQSAALAAASQTAFFRANGNGRADRSQVSQFPGMAILSRIVRPGASGSKIDLRFQTISRLELTQDLSAGLRNLLGRGTLVAFDVEARELRNGVRALGEGNVSPGSPAWYEDRLA